MKRKLLIIFLSIVTVVCLAFGISACSGTNNPVTEESLSYTLNSDGNSYSVTGIGSVNSSTIEIPDTYNDLPVTSIGKSAFSNSRVRFTTVIIPDSVTSIGEFAFYQCGALTTVTMGAGVTSIGGSAFSYCNSLISVSMSNALTFIGEEAFYCCSSLESVTIPDSVTSSIAKNTFYHCTSLKSVVMGSSVTSIGENAFNGCSMITSIDIPDSVTSIGSYAFNGCSSLESITIPDSVVSSIGEYTFYNCTALKSAVIGDGVTYIDNMAFYNCELLASVTIGNSVISIETNAFGHCTSLESVVLDSGLETIGYEAFAYCSSLTSIVIPDSVTYIDEFAFSHCTSLTSVTIGENVTYIADTAFNDCYRLVEVYNLSSLNIVSEDQNSSYYIVNIYTSADEESRLFMQDDYQFIYDVNNKNYCLVGYFGTDTELILPELSVNGNATKYYIRSYAFCECDSLTDVVISSGVTSVGYHAFYNCTSLTSVTIGKDVSNISVRAFYGCYKLVEVYNLSSLSLTAGSTSNGYVACYAINIYKSADTESHVFTQDDYQFIYDSKNNYYLIGYSGTDTDITLPQLTVNDDVVTYSINQYTFYFGSLTSVVIPDSVTSIGDSAFRYCGKLASITIGENVETIGDSAFGACSSLVSITLPDKVTTIGNNVFNSCRALTSITIGKSVTSIGDYAFSYCSSLTEFNYNAISMADLSSDNGVFNYAVDSGIAVNIGDDVITVPSYLFSSCASKITSLTIGESVSYISNNAFSGLTALTEINFNATAMSDLAEDNNVFYNAGQSGNGITVNIGANVTKIPANLYNPASSESYAPKIASVNFAENSECASIGDYAFAYCTTLTGITNLPAAATFSTNIVMGCTNFEISSLYTIYNNVNYLGAQMLNVVDTTAEIVVVKDDTTSIAENAFANCTNLRIVYIPSSVTEIGDNALVCGADSELIIYFGASSSSSLFNNYTSWLGTYSYSYTYNGTEVSTDIYYSYDTGVTLTDNYLHTSSTVYGYIGTETVISIPSTLNSKTITTVGYSATVRVTNDVTYVRPLSSFIGVTSITMPSTITKVDGYAFYNNTTLESVTFLSDSGSLLVNSCAFYGCTNLSSVTFTEGAKLQLQSQSFYGCTSLKSIVIPSTAYIINANAFEGAGLTSITLTGFTYATLLDSDATSQGSLTLSDYTAAQLAAYITGDYAAYNWYLFSF